MADTETGLALYHTMTEAFLIIDAQQWSALSSPALVPPDAETIDILRAQGFLLDPAVDENTVFECWKQEQVHDFDTITSKVNVTRKCNNRCTYCILDYEPKEMTAATCMAMDGFYIDFIKEKRPLKARDDYLGGEPLLNTKILLASVGRRSAHCRKQGVNYGFTITSNGRLLEPGIVSELKKSGLTGIRVSLAGPKDVHDRLRPSAAGKGTYAEIMKNLTAVSKLAPIIIECQYDSGSDDYKRMDEIFEDFRTYDIDISEIHFTPILRKKGESLFNCGLGDPKIALALTKLSAKYGYAQAPQAPGYLCRADFKSMFVFDTDGSIIPCTGFQEGEMAYGNVFTGIDFIAESQLLKRNLPDQCQNHCPLLPICMGGCRHQALVYKEDFSGTDCQYDSIKLFLDDYIRTRASEIMEPESQPASEIAA